MARDFGSVRRSTMSARSSSAPGCWTRGPARRARARRDQSAPGRGSLADRRCPVARARTSVRVVPPRALGRRRIPHRARRRRHPARGPCARGRRRVRCDDLAATVPRSPAVDEAALEVERCAGGQFDPQLAEVFVEAYAAGEIARRRSRSRCSDLSRGAEGEAQPSRAPRPRASSSSLPDHLVRELDRAGVPAEVGRPDAAGDRLEAPFANRPAGGLRPLVVGVTEEGRAGEDHRHRVGDVLAEERRRGAVRRLGHQRGRNVVVTERDEHRLGSRDRAEQAAARDRRGCRRRG